MKKIIIVCGLISGIILCIFMVASLAILDQNYESGMIYGYAAMILAFSLIYVGIRNFRDKYKEGLITFGKAFKIGLYITLIGSTMYVITWLIEYYFFIPDYMDKYADHMMKNINMNAMSRLQIDDQLKSITSMKEMYKNPLFVILLTYAEVLPVGLAISVISALMLKKNVRNKDLIVTT